MSSQFNLSVFDNLDELQKYRISIDIFYKNKYLTIQTINANGITESQLALDEVLYLMDTGTAASPGKFVLDHILNWAANQTGIALDKIVDNILGKDWGQKEIRHAFRELEIKINNYINSYFLNYYNSQELFGQKNLLLFDPNLFKKYIRCKISKNV